MKLGFEHFTGLLAQSLLNQPAGVAAFGTREAFGFNVGLTIGSNNDFNGFQCCGIQITPPTRIVNLIDPSVSGCSNTVCPSFLASSLAFSTA